MTDFDPAASAIWKDNDSGAPYNPGKSLIRTWGGKVEAAVAALESAVTALQSVGTDGYVLRESVVAAAPGNVALTGAYTVDGVTVTNGQRYLAPNQTDASENGVYVYNSAGAHTRATDMDAAGEVQGSAFAVIGGSTYEGWILKTETEVTTLGTDDIEFYPAVDIGSILTAINTHAANETDPHGATATGMAVLKAADAAAVRSALSLATVATTGDSDDLTEGATNLLMTAAERSKLAGVAAGATTDQTGAEIKTLYEAEDDTNAFTDAEKAKLGGVADGATKAPQADRPGDNPDAFSATYTGEGADKTPLTGGTVVSGAGLAYIQSGAGVIAARYPVALNNDVIEFTARFRRTSNPSDPNNHAILLRVAWLDKDKALIGSVATLATKSDALTSSGLVELSARVSALAVDDVTAPPSGAVYACPFIQTYGDDGVTAVETLRISEVTDLHVLESADLSQVIADAQAATAAAEAAADLVATETLDAMADVSSYTRAAGVGAITLKGGYAAFDGLGGQWVYDASDTTSSSNPPHVLVGNDGARYKPAAARFFDTIADLKLAPVASLPQGASAVAAGIPVRWEPDIPVETHQSDTFERVYIAPDAAADGAWVTNTPPEPLPAFDQIKMRMLRGRVDFVGIGDSNQLYSVHGWDHGLAYGLDQIAPMYATGLISVNENDANGAGTGYEYAFNGSQPLIGATSGAPAALDAYWDADAGSVAGQPHDYAYLASGTFSGGSNSGLTLAADMPLNPASNDLRYHVNYGTFTTGSGQFRISIRLAGSPYTTLTESATISTNTGAETMQVATVDLTASGAYAGASLNCKLTGASVGITGPYFATFQRVEAVDVSAGWAYHTLLGAGGWSLRDMADGLQQCSDEALAHFFGEVRRLQGDAKTVVITVNAGLNDRSEASASVGDAAISDGDSAEAYVDNFAALRARIEGVWTDEGWSLSEIYWLLMPSHPISDPDDAELVAYRQALADYARTMDRAQVVNLAEITTSAAILARGGYQSSGADKSHLTQSEFEYLGDKIIGATR